MTDESTVELIYDEDGDNVDITNHAVVSGATFDAASNATPGTCEVVLRDLDRELAFTTGKRLKLKIDGQPLWAGFLTMLGRSSFLPAGDGQVATRTRRWILHGVDNNILADKRVLRNTANYLTHIPFITTDTFDGAILRNALATYADMPSWLDISSEIDDVVVPSGQSITSANPYDIGAQGSAIRALAESLAAWSAAVWYIGPDDKVHFHAIQDRESPWGFSDRPNNAPITAMTGFEGAYHGFRELDSEEDGSQFVTDAFVWGGSAFAGAGGTVFHRATDATLEAEHGKWQYPEAHFGETNFKTAGTVTQRANVIVFGNPTGDPTGAAPGSVPGEGPRGLRFPQWDYGFTWFTRQVPLLAGVPRHIYPGDLVSIQLWAYSQDGGVTPFSKFLPLRSLRISFDTATASGKAVVRFNGGFDLRNEDSKFLWKYLRKRAAAVATTVAVVTDTSPSTTYGASGQFSLSPAPDGVNTVFFDTPGFGYIPNTTSVYIDPDGNGGLLQTRGVDYTESNPDTGQITFTVAPAVGSILSVTMLTLPTDQPALPGGTPPDAAAGELQGYIDAATAGSTITVPWKTYHEHVTINKALTIIGSAGAVIDADNTRTQWVTIGHSDVELREFRMINAAPGAFQLGGVECHNHDRFKLTRCYIYKGPNAGISLQFGTGHRLTDVEVEHCPMAGMSSGGYTDLKILGTGNVNWPARWHHNRTSLSEDPLNEGGAFKFAKASNVEIAYIEVDHNAGPGIWADLNCQNVNVHDVRAHHNTHASIFFEISATGSIHDNSVWENGWDLVIDATTYTHDTRGDSFGWPGAILCSSSKLVEVYNNLLAWNRVGLAVIYQAGRSPVGDPTNSGCQVPATGIYEHDCTVIAEAGRYGETWSQDGSGGTLYSDSTNRGVRLNFNYPSNTGSFTYNGGKDLAAMNASNGNEGGVYISDAVAANMLTTAGMPLAPEAH